MECIRFCLYSICGNRMEIALGIIVLLLVLLLAVYREVHFGQMRAKQLDPLKENIKKTEERAKINDQKDLENASATTVVGLLNRMRSEDPGGD